MKKLFQQPEKREYLIYKAHPNSKAQKNSCINSKAHDTLHTSILKHRKKCIPKL